MRLFIDDKTATIKEVCDLLSIRELDVPFSHKTKTFERLGIKGMRDVQNNKPIIPRGHGIPCIIDITLKSGDVKRIIYSENQRQQTRNGVTTMKHTPMNLELPGLELSVLEKEKNKFFFLYIHPYNKVSPLNMGKENPNCVYEFLDNEKGAKQEQQKEDLLLQALLRLKDLDDKAVLQIAKGYKEYGVDDLTPAEVRKLVRERLKKDPGQFILDLDNNEVALDGIIQDAIDNKVILVKESGLNNIYLIDEREICNIQKGVNEISAIRSIVESNPDVYMPLLLNGISTKQSASVLKKPEVNKYFDNFKKSDYKAGEVTGLDASEAAELRNATREAEEVEKLRRWATQNLLDAALNTNTKKAIVANGDKIIAQFRKDIADGLIPEGTPEPMVVMPTA